MDVIAIPRQSIDWLVSSAVGRTDGQDTVAHTILADLMAGVPKAAYVSTGPLRMRSDDSVIVLWHRDYAASGSEVEWALFRLTGPLGLLDGNEPTPIRKLAWARMHRVAHLRLRNLGLSNSFQARYFEGSRGVCTAGRGENAWQRAIAWSDYRVGQSRVLTFLGPWQDPADNAQAQQATLLDRLSNDRGLFLDWYRRALQLRVSPLDSYSHHGWSETRTVVEEMFSATIDIVGGEDGALATAPMHKQPVPLEGLTYAQWIEGDRLTRVQRSVLDLELVGRAPVRIQGQAGSGKSLLLQLAAVRYSSEERAGEARVLYLVHNASAKDIVSARLEGLAGDDEDLLSCVIECVSVRTIADLAAEYLPSFETAQLLDSDNETSRQSQIGLISAALSEQLSRIGAEGDADLYPLFRTALGDSRLTERLASSIAAEIGFVIKAQLADQDEEAYVLAELPLSNFHGLLTEKERRVVYRVFEAYDQDVSLNSGLLDNDDVALSLIQTMGTPLWRALRKSRGCDLLVVDEAQHYSPTEKILFHYLTKTLAAPYPILLAMDKAQDLEGRTEAGLGTFGLGDVRNTELKDMQRCAWPVTRLALGIIFQSIDIFDVDFPTFAEADVPTEDDAGKAAIPVIVRPETQTIGKGAMRQARQLRARNMRSVGVVAMTSDAMESICKHVNEKDILVLQDRSSKLPEYPHIAVGKPSTVGGLEFDAVVIVGGEHPHFPQQVPNAAFQSILIQRALRELYLAITRARKEVAFVLSPKGQVTALLSPSIKKGHVVEP